MLNPHLLQLIRLEVATFGSEAGDLPCLRRPDQAELQHHFARLFLGGELAGRCFIEDGSLYLEVDSLTAYGHLEMCAFRSRFPNTADDDDWDL